MKGIEVRIGNILKERGLTVSSAESCTGGNIAHLFTSVAGSSAYFLGGVVSYDPSVKVGVLGVPAATIEEYGVVSAEVASSMAIGVRKLIGSDYSVATTGLAGPSGDGSYPVGTVWMAVDCEKGVFTKLVQVSGDRKSNIDSFTEAALEFLLEVLA